jgi:hypothetical protein
VLYGIQGTSEQIACFYGLLLQYMM